MEKKVQEQAEDNNLKTHFESRYLSERIDFLQEYDFVKDESNFEYFKSFIFDFELTKNDWYNSLIINLADELNIVHNSFYKRYLNYLTNRKYYLFRLSILDYFANNHIFYKKIYRQKDFEIIKNSRNLRRIVKNQVIVNDLIFDLKNKRIYIDELKKSYRVTQDYKSHIRLYNYIMNFELDEIISKTDLNYLVETTQNKKLGRAVDLKLLEFANYFNGK
ncbi:hypothetical protein [Chryseobacterium gambrini]|uniref:hypothetical protein n=1 Tax=Chryseobacterium gambrini TaxID=373672 RepID=UPI0022F3E061|nr:hypothetical protein [Chryseobacterium gambrini]WBX96342.1 hypothetical protein PE065_16010 [Chryseobacterium gambrini]